MLRPGTRPLLAGVAVLFLVAACAQASTGASTVPTQAPLTAQPSAAASSSVAPSAAASGGEAYEVDVAQDAKLGAYLTGEDGKSLYLLMTDSAGKSTCTGDCAANWPPFVLDTGETVKAGTGVTGTIATFTRADGSTQVTINGLPLYYFSGDTAAGQTNGQGIASKWYLAGPDGKPVGAAAAAASPGSSKSTCVGYYCP